mmetsp:Transcript_96661/g.141392  ORF Transcript_96661/g.141392 Transcript_96661/m.141392 type:complete len:88 (-) Transcript_96661:408-671(-)
MNGQDSALQRNMTQRILQYVKHHLGANVGHCKMSDTIGLISLATDRPRGSFQRASKFSPSLYPILSWKCTDKTVDQGADVQGTPSHC